MNSPQHKTIYFSLGVRNWLIKVELSRSLRGPDSVAVRKEPPLFEYGVMTRARHTLVSATAIVLVHTSLTIHYMLTGVAKA
jgi:hypothetical protein